MIEATSSDAWVRWTGRGHWVKRLGIREGIVWYEAHDVVEKLAIEHARVEVCLDSPGPLKVAIGPVDHALSVGILEVSSLSNRHVVILSHVVVDLGPKALERPSHVHSVAVDCVMLDDFTQPSDHHFGSFVDVVLLVGGNSRLKEACSLHIVIRVAAFDALW